MFRYIRLFTAATIVAALSLSLTGCFTAAEKKYSDDKFLMDTFISIEAYGEDEEALQIAVEDAFEVMTRMNALTDRYPKKGTKAFRISDVCRINANAGVMPVEVSDDVFDMVRLSLEYYHKSQGSFDITVGPLVDLWGFTDDPPHKVPSDADLKKSLAMVDADWVKLDPVTKTVFLTHPGMILDLGAIAKGYAAEKAARCLRSHGIKRALINAGGNIIVVGNRAEGKKWRIGVEDPRDREKIIGVLELSDSAAVTSGDYQRNFTVDNVLYHHILSPLTGMPARETISVTVVAKDSGLADVLSTTLFVLGPEKGIKLAESLDGVEAVFVGADKRIYVSGGMKDIFIPEENCGYKYSGE